MGDTRLTSHTNISTLGKRHHQNDTTTPYIHFSAGIKSIRGNEFGSSVAWTTAACLHQISDFSVLLCSQDVIVIFVDFIRIESISKPKVCNDDVPILIKQKIFLLWETSAAVSYQFEISMNDTFLMQIWNAADQLCEKFTSYMVLQITMGEDVAEQFPTACIFEDNANVSVGIFDVA